MLKMVSVCVWRLLPCGINHVVDVAQLTVTSKGGLVQEVRQEFAPWAIQYVRLYSGMDIEFEYQIGPIPVDDDLGMNMIASGLHRFLDASMFCRQGDHHSIRHQPGHPRHVVHRRQRTRGTLLHVDWLPPPSQQC